MRILVVEDDAPLASFIRKRLESESYGVEVALDGEQANTMARDSDYDLVLLDLSLPKLDGISVLRDLRPAKPQLPVLVLTARSSVEDRVLALDSGTDDCLTKPFSYYELSARVRALLRRGKEPAADVSEIADLHVDRRAFRAVRAGRTLPLTSREFSLLEYLARHPRRPVTRDELLEHVWNRPPSESSNIVDVYVKYLRDKVDGGFEFKLFRTIRGIGYELSDQ